MGSIQKRKWGEDSKPRWVARVRVSGKQRSKSFATQREAKDWVREQEGLQPTGARTDNKLLGPIVQSWAEQASGSTQVGRQHLHDNLGALKYKRLGDVSTDDVRLWRQRLAEGREWADGKTLSHTTIATLTRHLSAVFNDAVAHGQIPRNPVLGARKGAGKVESTTVVDPADLMTVTQVQAMVAQSDPPFTAMLRLMATSGLRPGEIAGLRVRSVDLERGTVHVTEQAAGEYGEWAWAALKSAKSRRTVPLPSDTVKALRDHLADHDYPPESPLFRTERDYQWSTPHIGKVWRDVAKAARVTGQSPKSLRHFYASALIRAGESVTVVQARLGHASPTVTLGVYAHMWEDSAESTRKAVEGLI